MCQFINSNDVFANPDNKDYICYNEAFHDKFKTASTKYKMNVRKQPIYTPEK